MGCVNLTPVLHKLKAMHITYYFTTSWIHRVSNYEVSIRIGETPILLKQVHNRKNTWICHILRHQTCWPQFWRYMKRVEIVEEGPD